MSTAPAIFCLDDFQYYDEGSLRVVKSLLKKSKRILLIVLLRDQSLDPGTQGNQLNLVEQYVSEMEDYVPHQQNFTFYLNGFSHEVNSETQLRQFIQKVFKIKEYTFESSRVAKTIVSAIFKQQSRRVIQRRTLGVRYTLDIFNQ